MSSSVLQSAKASVTQPLLMMPDDLIDPTRAAALRFSRFPVVDAAARSLALAIVDQYITRAWLDQLTLNRDMPRAVLATLAHASRQLEDRILLIPWHSVLLVDLPTVLGNHYAAFAGARAAVSVSSSSVLHQPQSVPKVGAEAGGFRGRGGKQPPAALPATQTSANSHSSILSNRPASALQVPSHSSRSSHLPPQLTPQSGSSASLAPTMLPSTPTQPQAPRPPPITPSPTAESPGWPTASTPVDQFTPTDAKFSLLMPHIALEPSLNLAPPASSMSPSSAALPGFNDYLRTVASVLLDAFLPTATLEAEAERVLIREIVAGVLGMVIEAMSDPVMLLKAITAAFEASSQHSWTAAQHASSSSPASLSNSQRPSSTPPRAENNYSPASKPPLSSHSQQDSHSATLHLTFSSATLHSYWTRVVSASHWAWYQATLMWHTLVQRVRSSSATTGSRVPALSTSPWTRTSNSTRPPSTRHLVHQADVILFNTLDQLLHLTHNPATRPWTLLWQLWLRPPIRFLFGSWVDTYLHVAVMYPWSAHMVARMVTWVTENVVLKPQPGAAGEEEPASPPASSPPDMHQLLVQCVDAIVLATGTPALRPVLTDHTLRAIASRYRNRQLVVRIVDVLVAHVVAAGARATAAATSAGSRTGAYQGGGNNVSPGADALLLTGRRRGGGSRSSAGVAAATTSAGHRHLPSVSGSIARTDSSRSVTTKMGLRRTSDVGSGAHGLASSSTVGSGAGAFLASSATATATATSVVASMATSVSASSGSAMRHRRSRSTGGAFHLGTSRVSASVATNATSSPTRASGPIPSAVGRRQSVAAELVYRESGPLPPVPPLPRAASAGPTGSMGVGGSPRVQDGDRRRRRE